MDPQTWIAIVFIVVMSVLLYINRKKFQVSGFFPLLYFVMLRTTWGLKAMDWMGKKLRTPVRWFGYASIVVGFLGMAFIIYSLVQSTVMLFTSPATAPGIQPVLPFEAKGVFFVPFAYWIISIFVIAVIHEFAHGVVARAHDLKVKSSGFAFLGILAPIIPAAFVEPDEKQVVKRPASQQWSVFAAGPMANIVTAFLIIFAFGLDASPILPHSITGRTAIVDFTELSQELKVLTGLQVNEIAPGSPAEAAGIPAGATITAINGIALSDEQITQSIANLQPGQQLTLTADGVDYPLILQPHPQDASRGYIGITFAPVTEPSQAALAKYGSFGVQSLSFFMSLMVWIFILSLGIGLFNLIPLGPIDGGRMFKLAAEKVMGVRGTQVWKLVSFAILGMIFINLFAGFFA